jgi:nucleoside-diphosphate-sugar epimerase
MSSILITGGTGFIGRYVVRELRRREQEVLLFARSTSDTREAVELGCEIFTGDLCNFEQVRQAVKQSRYIIHVGEIEFRIKNATRLNVDLVKIMVEAARETEDFRRLVQVSSISVVCPPTTIPATEDTPTLTLIRDNSTVYKRRCEEILQSSDLPSTIVRGTFVYGPGANYLLWFARWLNRTRWLGLPLPGRHDAKLSLIHATDFAKVLASAALDDGPGRRVFNAADDEGCTLKDFVDQLGLELSIPFQLMQIPLPVQRVFAHCVDGPLSLFGLPPNARGILDFLGYHGIFSNEKMKRELGIQLSYSTVREGMPEFAKWIAGNLG